MGVVSSIQIFLDVWKFLNFARPLNNLSDATEAYSQQTRYIEPILAQNWAGVVDVGPTLSQHWANIAFCPLPLNHFLNTHLTTLLGPISDRYSLIIIMCAYKVIRSVGIFYHCLLFQHIGSIMP